GAAAFTKLRWHCVRFQPDIQRWFRREMNYQSLAHSRAVAVGLPYPAELLWCRFSAVARRIYAEISAAWAVVHCAMATLFPSVKIPSAQTFGSTTCERNESPNGARLDLVSEAVAPGTIQVPPSGMPILLLGDCQTIGGYPKIAQVITVDLSVAAQLCAGDHVRFSEVSIADAHGLLLQRERELERFRIGLSLHDS